MQNDNFGEKGPENGMKHTAVKRKKSMPLTVCIALKAEGINEARDLKFAFVCQILADTRLMFDHGECTTSQGDSTIFSFLY